MKPRVYLLEHFTGLPEWITVGLLIRDVYYTSV